MKYAASRKSNVSSTNGPAATIISRTDINVVRIIRGIGSISWDSLRALFPTPGRLNTLFVCRYLEAKLGHTQCALFGFASVIIPEDAAYYFEWQSFRSRWSAPSVGSDHTRDWLIHGCASAAGIKSLRRSLITTDKPTLIYWKTKSLAAVAPRARKVDREIHWKCESAKQMKVGPSEPACRRRLQTASSGCGRKVHGGER